MKPTNIFSAFHGIKAFEECKSTEKQGNAPYSLSNSEAKTLRLLCDILKSQDNSFEIFDGYYIGYKIKQISKEFDLLRFSDDLVVDIELKQELNLMEEDKIEKVLKQQLENYYYLKALQKNIYICTFVENDGLYEYDSNTNTTSKIAFEKLLHILKNQKFNESIDPNKLFVPSNYLVSPFNNTDRFLEGEYFLTNHQKEIKTKLLNSISTQYEMFCITADAGTGKTLLVYDIAKTISQDSKILLIHCGKLNNGHNTLINKHNWNIHSIRDIRATSIDEYINDKVKTIFIDEAQRIRSRQLELILEKSKELNIPIIFSYDTKQYLSEGESKDIFEHISLNYPDLKVEKKTLTNKIRTNKNISSFITNLTQIGRSSNSLNYSDVTIEYFEDIVDMKKYIDYLEKYKGWTFITYTNSQYRCEHIDTLAGLSDRKAHDVIGQEFEKVVFVMDDNFGYADNGRLIYDSSYYSLPGMFYQIATRVINEMKIIVFKNKPLYYRLLEIKSFDKSNE